MKLKQLNLIVAALLCFLANVALAQENPVGVDIEADIQANAVEDRGINDEQIFNNALKLEHAGHLNPALEELTQENPVGIDIEADIQANAVEDRGINDEQIFNNALELEHAGHLNPALEELTQENPVGIDIEADIQANAVEDRGINDEQIFNNALKLEHAGHLNPALEILSGLLHRKPGHPAARLAYGRILVMTGEYREAAVTFLPLLKKDNKRWQAWFWAGTAELMLGHFDTASMYLDEALAREGRRAALWVQRALVEQQQGRHRTAIRMLEIAEEIAPQLPKVALNMAVSLDALGYSNNALQYYRRYLLLTANDKKTSLVRKNVLKRFTHMAR